MFEHSIISHRYKIVERISEGGMSIIYRALDLKNENKEVAVKILKAELTSDRIEDVIRFQSEANTISRLDHPHIIKLIEVGEYEGIQFLVMEFSSAVGLQQYMQNKKHFSLNESLDIICKTVEVLDYIHEKGILHRDLKPGNMLIKYKDSGHGEELIIDEFKIIDFGLAQIKDFSMIKNRDEIVGTFSYMSPEQTGALKRPIDERSDLYSVGIIFYQLLTKELPFKGDTVSSLIHQHIAKVPSPLSWLRSDMPLIVEKIIIKLLEKEPERRYQSAKGLLHDLHKLKEGNLDFIPGLEDKNVKLNYRTPLIGRDKEFKRLKELFNDSLHGKGAFCLISGEAGRGKTRLVEELGEYVYSKNASFIYGKSFSGINKIPFGCFKDVLNCYIKDFNKYDDLSKKNIREKLSSAIGKLGDIVIRLNPLTKDILGECPSLAELDPERENQRFLMVASQFFFQLSKIENGLVILLDDIHWADESTLALLKEIMHEIAKYPLFVIGTYRDNEIDSHKGLGRFLLNLTSESVSTHEIHLEPFSATDIHDFVARLLFYESENVKEIAAFINTKSKGNPFFTIEILKQLVEEKAIYYKDKSWNINNTILEELEISANIIDVLIKRINLLTEKESRLLSLAALIGRKFSIDLLFRLAHFSHAEVVAIVDRSIQLQLLEEDNKEKGNILFVHERIKEAFYQKLREYERERYHLQIAKTLEATHKDNSDLIIFQLAHHYSEAHDNEGIIRYSLPAAAKAEMNYANELAIRYYKKVIEILESRGLKGSTDWVNANEGLIRVYLIIGRSDEAIEISNIVLAYKKDNIEKAKIFRLLGRAFFKKGDWRNCESNLEKGLLLLGEKIPSATLNLYRNIFKEFIVHILHNIFLSKSFQKEKSPEKIKYIESVWFRMTLNWFYILNDLNKFLWSVLRALNVTESNIGKSRELGVTLGGYAALCMSIPLFDRALIYHKKALSIRKELQDEWGISQSLQWLGFCYAWQGQYDKSTEVLLQSKDIFEKMGDLWETGMVLLGLGLNKLYTGDFHEAMDHFQAYIQISRKLNDEFGICSALAYISQTFIFIGDFQKAEENIEEGLRMSENYQIWMILCISNIDYGRLYLELGEHKKAIEHLQKAKDLFESNNFIKNYTVHLYALLAEAYLKKYLNENECIKRKEKKALLARIKATCKKSLKETKKWPTHYGSALRVNGLYYSIINNIKKAEQYFKASIEHCGSINRKFDLAKSYYEYGLFLNNNGKYESSKEMLEHAYALFKSLKAEKYTRKLASILNKKDESREDLIEKLKDKQKLSSIINVSQNISSILNLNELLDQIMSKAIEVTGAQNGFLFLLDNDNELSLKVSKHISGKNYAEYSRNVVNNVFRSRLPVISTNAQEDKNYEIYHSIAEYGLKSILCIPIVHRNNFIGVCYVDNPLSAGVFSEEDIEILDVIMTQAAISINNARLFNDLFQVISSLIANSSSRIYEYSQKVSNISVLLAKRLKFNQEEVEQIKIAALLHDLSLIGYLEKLYFSKKKLTEEEQNLILNHPGKSAEIIKHIEELGPIREIIHQHHEHYDGSGYPDQLKGEQLNAGGRIIKLVDDFVTLIRKREYQVKNKKEKIIQDLLQKKGTVYDPKFLDVFINLVNTENLIYAVDEFDIYYEERNDETTWKIPSNLDFESIVVGKVIQKIKNVIRDEELLDLIDYSISEVIRNAIIHGNEYNEDKFVSITIRMLDLDNNRIRLCIKVKDEGEGMDIKEHDLFSESRMELLTVIDMLDIYKIDAKVEDKKFEQILDKLRLFVGNYFADYYSYKRIEDSDYSGGIGLIFVKNTFDKVEFNNIICDNLICGLEVILEKEIQL